MGSTPCTQVVCTEHPCKLEDDECDNAEYTAVQDDDDWYINN